MAYIDQITEPLLIQSYMILFLISLTLCFVIILSSRYDINRRAALDEVAVQSAHKGFVPRVGGLAIFISILGLIPLLTFGFIPVNIVLDLKIDEMTYLIFSAIPIFFVGITEDLGYRMSPKKRLIASAISGLIVITIFNVWLTKLGIPGVDNFLSFAPLGIFFTLFATVGVVNSFNLIDGLNGFSSFVTLSTATALSIIAFEVDYPQIAIFLALVSASVLGFMVFNFPFGRIFLGDGGAYVLGHLLVWSAILLINHDSSISSFSILLIFFWPVADTGLAIWRRLKLGNPTDKPDRLHFHHVAMRFIEIRFFGRDRRNIANPLATVILIPFISFPQIMGIYFWADFTTSVWCSIFMGTLFVVTYVVGINLAKKPRNTN